MAQGATPTPPLERHGKGRESSYTEVTMTAQTLEDWTSLPNKRVLFVEFASGEVANRFLTSWPSHEQFFSTQTNVSLLIACPHRDLHAIRAKTADAFNWTLKGELTHDHDFAHGPLQWYETQLGVEVFIQPIIVHVPAYFLNARPPIVPRCVNNQWNLAYIMYSGAVFSHHLLHLPLLAKYEWFVQIDLDIAFQGSFPVDIGTDLAEKGCSVMHSALHGTSDCEDDNYRGLLEASAALNLGFPKSGKYEWCNMNGTNFKTAWMLHGNFLGFATKFVRQSEVQRLSTYLYDEFKDGYFLHRWGDQGAQILYVCQMLDVPDIFNDTQICDYASYRLAYFSHGK